MNSTKTTIGFEIEIPRILFAAGGSRNMGIIECKGIPLWKITTDNTYVLEMISFPFDIATPPISDGAIFKSLFLFVHGLIRQRKNAQAAQCKKLNIRTQKVSCVEVEYNQSTPIKVLSSNLDKNTWVSICRKDTVGDTYFLQSLNVAEDATFKLSKSAYTMSEQNNFGIHCTFGFDEIEKVNILTSFLKLNESQSYMALYQKGKHPYSEDSFNLFSEIFDSKDNKAFSSLEFIKMMCVSAFKKNAANESYPKGLFELLPRVRLNAFNYPDILKKNVNNIVNYIEKTIVMAQLNPAPFQTGKLEGLQFQLIPGNHKSWQKGTGEATYKTNISLKTYIKSILNNDLNETKTNLKKTAGFTKDVFGYDCSSVIDMHDFNSPPVFSIMSHTQPLGYYSLCDISKKEQEFPQPSKKFPLFMLESRTYDALIPLAYKHKTEPMDSVVFLSLFSAVLRRLEETVKIVGQEMSTV